jgi:hypothetical protein
MSKYLYNDLTEGIIKAFYATCTRLGPRRQGGARKMPPSRKIQYQAVIPSYILPPFARIIGRR